MPQIKLSDEVYQRLYGIKEGAGHTSFDSVLRTVLLRLDATTLIRSREEIQKEKERIEDERLKYRNGSVYEIFLGGIVQGLHYVLFQNAAITMRSDIEGKSREEDLDSEEGTNKK